MRGLYGGVYRGARVLVTGHTGFKGAWLSLWLNELGADVAGYALPPPTRPSLFGALNLSQSIKHITGDVRDRKELARVMRRFRPEFVFHLAAQSLVRRAYVEPAETIESNVLGTVSVLEALRQSDSVRACVVVTSDKCYENREWAYAYRENDALGGHDPYSASKGCAEIVTAAWRDSFLLAKGSKRGVAIATARAGNVVGGGDWSEDRIVPDCVRALARGQPVVVRNPGSVRPWQFVLDPLAAYLHLASRMVHDRSAYAGAWNFGPAPSDVIPVGKLVSAIVARWGSGAWTSPAPKSRAPHEAKLLKLDCTRAHDLLQWRPVYGLSETLEQAVAWYRSYYDGERGDPLRQRSRRQLQHFVTVARERGLAWVGVAPRPATRA